jgi:hypothetical protein
MWPGKSQAAKPAIMRGIGVGLIAGIPQVLVTQAEGFLLSVPRSQADIGPRFVSRLSELLDARVPTVAHWLVAGAFHFGYAAFWGLVYTLLQRWRPAQPHVGGPLLGALIYAAAFSPWGAATNTGTEQPVEQRHTHETLLHWTAALSYSLTLAYLFARIERWPRTDPVLSLRDAARN